MTKEEAKLLYGDEYRPGMENRRENEELILPPEIIPTDEERARLLYGDEYRPGMENRDRSKEELRIPPELIPTDEEIAEAFGQKKPEEDKGPKP